MAKKNKGTGMWFPVLILVIMVSVAVLVGVQAAGVKLKPNKAGQSVAVDKGKIEEEKGSAALQEKQEAEPIQGVLRQVDRDGQTVRIYHIARMQEIELRYSGATQVQTRYGNEISMLQLTPGLLVEAVCEQGTEEMMSIREFDGGWTYKGIVNLDINKIDHIITIGDQKYQYDEQLLVVNQGKQVELDSLSEKDVLTARGVDGKIYSLEVTKGHGILTFAHYEDFVGGYIEVGYEIFEQISANMEYELREGNYKLSMRNGHLAVNKYITIERNQTQVVDLNEYRNQVDKKGLVSFYLNPDEAELYLDNELVDASMPVELGYGEYILEVYCEGYEDCSRLLTVSMPTQTIRIDLADISTADEEDALTELEKDDPSDEYDDYWDEYDDEYDDEYEEEEPEGDDIVEIDDEDTSDVLEDPEESEEDDSGQVIRDRHMMIRKPEGAEVYFDGAYVGTAPVQLDKVTGEHQITFKRKGYISKTYTIEVENDGENPVFSFPDLTQE